MLNGNGHNNNNGDSNVTIKYSFHHLIHSHDRNLLSFILIYPNGNLKIVVFKINSELLIDSFSGEIEVDRIISSGCHRSRRASAAGVRECASPFSFKYLSGVASVAPHPAGKECSHKHSDAQKLSTGRSTNLN